MWNITNSSLLSLNKKFKQSDSINIRKYKGGANEKLNAVTSPKRKNTESLANNSINNFQNSNSKRDGLVSEDGISSRVISFDPTRRSIDGSQLSGMVLSSPKFEKNID